MENSILLGSVIIVSSFILTGYIILLGVNSHYSGKICTNSDELASMPFVFNALATDVEKYGDRIHTRMGDRWKLERSDDAKQLSADLMSKGLHYRLLCNVVDDTLAAYVVNDSGSYSVDMGFVDFSRSDVRVKSAIKRLFDYQALPEDCFQHTPFSGECGLDLRIPEGAVLVLPS